MKDQSFAPATHRPNIILRRYIVNYHMQLEIILYGLSLLTIVMGFMYWTVNRTMNFLANPASSGVMPAAASGYYSNLAELRSYINYMFLGTYALSVIAMFLGLLILSNRIAGPIFRMTKIVREAGYQKYDASKPFKIRQGDCFQELLDELNALLKRI